MNIYLVRSGRTELSAEGRLQGRLDHPLIPEGKADAAAAGSQLGLTARVEVCSSPLLRARQSAEALVEVGKMPVTVIRELEDVDVGSWQGRTSAELREEDPFGFDAFFRYPRAWRFPSGESMADAERRVFDVLDTIVSRHEGDAVVVVTHELLIRLVLIRLRQLEGTAMWDPQVVPGSVSVLRRGSRGVEIPTVLEHLFRAGRNEEAGERTPRGRS